jgi:hypothetical protein
MGLGLPALRASQYHQGVQQKPAGPGIVRLTVRYILLTACLLHAADLDQLFQSI